MVLESVWALLEKPVPPPVSASCCLQKPDTPLPLCKGRGVRGLLVRRRLSE
jgi:hypothetical protein